MEIKFIFNNQEFTIFCEWGKTRSGFKHTATLKKSYKNNDFKNAIEYWEIDSAKCFYLNRTWESYQFESVIKKLIRQHFGNDYDSVLKLIKE